MIKPLIQLNMKSRFAAVGAVLHLLITEVFIIAVKNYRMYSHGWLKNSQFKTRAEIIYQI
jgi:hypothetical protein